MAYTRSIIDAIHNGSLLQANYSQTSIFGLNVPDKVEGVPAEILRPENMWANNLEYADTLQKLARQNFTGMDCS